MSSNKDFSVDGFNDHSKIGGINILLGISLVLKKGLCLGAEKSCSL